MTKVVLIKYFTIVANTSNIKNFVEDINDFFQKRIDFHKIQTGGKEFQISLNSEVPCKVALKFFCFFK